MKTRDKIPRTPVERGNRRDMRDFYVPVKEFNMQEYMRKHTNEPMLYDAQPNAYGNQEQTLNEQMLYMDQAHFIESLHHQIVGQAKSGGKDNHYIL